MAKEPPVSFRVTIVVPVRQPFGFDFVYYKHFKPSLTPVLNELWSFSLEDLRFSAYEARNFYCGLRKKNTKRKSKRYADAVAGRRFRMPCIELEWSADLTLRKFPGQRIDGKKAELKDRVSLAINEASDQFAATIIALLVASNIANPGVIFTYELEIWINNQFFATTTEELKHLVADVVEFARKNSWPKIEVLPLKDVWRWICSFETPSQNVGANALSRALNAFTHLLSRRWAQADGSISKQLDCPPILVGGVEDHIHLLARFGRTITQAEWVKELKRVSNLWLKEKGRDYADFEWQGGYADFSVSQSNLEQVKQYIARQEEHHRKMGFQDELRALLRKHEIEWDEKYVWD